MKLLVSLAVAGLAAVMAAPVFEPNENDLFNSAEYNEDCIEEVQAANFEPPAIFKDENPFADEAEDDCLDEVADEDDLDEFSLNDIDDAYPLAQKDAYEPIQPAFDQSSGDIYEFDEECEEEEVSQADADDSLLAFAVPQKDEFSPQSDAYEADCYDENAEAADELPAVMKDEPEGDDFFDFDNVLDNAQRAFDSQSEILEEDCVEEEDGDFEDAEEFNFGDDAGVSFKG